MIQVKNNSENSLSQDISPMAMLGGMRLKNNVNEMNYKDNL